MLLANGTEVNNASNDKTAALMFAAHNGHERVVDKLIDKGAKIAKLLYVESSTANKESNITLELAEGKTVCSNLKGASSLGNTVASILNEDNAPKLVGNLSDPD